MNPNIVEYFVEELQQSFTVDVVQIGYSLFKINGITDLVVFPDAVHAVVNGSDLRRYKVELDGDFFGISTCACKNAGYCEHMAALIFHAYGLTGKRPEMLMKEVRSSYDQEQNHQQIVGKRQQAKLQKEKLMLGLNNQNQSPYQIQTQPIPYNKQHQLEEGSPTSAWHLFFDNCMKKDKLTSEYDIQTFQRVFTSQIILAAEKWTEPLNRLYQIFMNLKFLSHLDSYFQFYHHSSQYTYYMQPSDSAHEDCWNHIFEALDEIDSDDLSKCYPAYVEAVISLMNAQILFHENSRIDWLELYRNLWYRLFIKPEWRESEGSRLKKLSNELNSTGAADFDKSKIGLLSAHLHVIRNEDTSAFQVLEPYASIYYPKLFYSYLDAFLDSGRWERLRAWLNWLKPMIMNENRDVFISYTQYWEHLHHNQPCQEEIEQVLFDFLPRSYYVYSHYLFEQKAYRQWVDMTMILDVPYDHWEAMYMDPIEKDDPQSIIPLYHKYIRQLIEKRNRESYKSAVKILKKLRTLYNRQKEQERWQQFISKLTHKYARLRALQEELKKGKMIS
jgi:hypothetical protein